MSRGKKMLEAALKLLDPCNTQDFPFIGTEENTLHVQSPTLSYLGAPQPSLQSVICSSEKSTLGLTYNPDNELLTVINSALKENSTLTQCSSELIALQPAFSDDYTESFAETSNIQDIGETNTHIFIDNSNDPNTNRLNRGNAISKPVDIVSENSGKKALLNQGSVKMNDAQANLVEKNCTKIKDQRLRRVQGLAYVGSKRHSNQITPIQKTARHIKSRCSHTTVERKSDRTFLCGQFSDKDRQVAFQRFWQIKSWAEKKMFVKGLVTTRKIRRRRKLEHKQKRKEEGHDIFISKADGTKLRVCRTFFINTLDIGEDTFKRWVKRDIQLETSASSEENVDDDFLPESQVDSNKGLVEKNKNPHNNRKAIKIQRDLAEHIKSWLNLLPKVPSHYCRSTSKKTYLEAVFRSTKHLHEVYKNWCDQQNVKAAGKTFFKKFLDTQNIAIHMPRKDQCDVCCGYKTKHISQQEYENHIRKKDEARAAKNEAKQSASKSKVVITMDLQSVLLSPKTLASKHYYKQKLQIHNFTIYVLNNKDVTLYVWHETNGGVTCNEFTSCIVDFISNQNKCYDHVVLISDGCAHQNRNKTLSSALSDIAVTQNITIEQLYLEKGHTMMEADSVHATLEKYFKPPINSPSDYFAKMRVARPTQPYNVRVLDYAFFKNYEKLESNLNSLRPGRNRAGDPVVTDIRAIKYLSNGEIFFKINHSDVYQILPQRKPLANSENHPKPLYNAPLPLAESKYRHLQDLKTVIEADHHAFYDNLPFKRDSREKKGRPPKKVKLNEENNQ